MNSQLTDGSIFSTAICRLSAEFHRILHQPTRSTWPRWLHSAIARDLTTGLG